MALEDEVMFTIMLLTISVIALSQFALYYWRAVLSGVAAQPVSDRVLAAAQVQNGRLTGEDFAHLAGLHDLTPELNPGRGGIALVRLYFSAIDGLKSATGRHMPALAGWIDRERVICARYAAVQIDRRLQTNLALAAALRSC
jgi:hypothetical protein